MFQPLKRYSTRRKLSDPRRVDIASFPVQECGVPHTEVQEYRQTSSGPPTELQPGSMPGADPRGPRQKPLQRCGSRLVLISMATGRFLYSWSPSCQILDRFHAASAEKNKSARVSQQIKCRSSSLDVPPAVKSYGVPSSSNVN